MVRSGSRAELMERENIFLVRITKWMDRHLTLALQKTEAVIFKGPRKREGIISPLETSKLFSQNVTDVWVSTYF